MTADPTRFEPASWHTLTGDLYCVDVGSRGGLDDLAALHARLHVYSVDADSAADGGAQRFASRRHFSLALHSSAGEADFFHAASPAMSSLLEFDPHAFVRHFGLMPGSREWARRLTPLRKERVRTETADRLFRAERLERVDFFKLDTQGTELEILKGALEHLRAGKIAVVKTEVSFVPVYRGQCVFADIDRFMKELGFVFVDCAFYPDGVVVREPAAAVGGTKLRERVRFSAGGDAFYVLDPERCADPDRAACAARSAVLLSQLGYASLALDLLSRAAFPRARAEALLGATAAVDRTPRWKRALGNHLPPSAYRGLQRLRRRWRAPA